MDVVKRINLLLQCWPSLTGTELKPVLYQVKCAHTLLTVVYQLCLLQTPQQRGGEDCGIHVIHDILTITKVAFAILIMIIQTQHPLNLYSTRNMPFLMVPLTTMSLKSMRRMLGKGF